MLKTSNTHTVSVDLDEHDIAGVLPEGVLNAFRQGEAIYPELSVHWFRNLAAHGLPSGEVARCISLCLGTETYLLPVRFLPGEHVLQGLSTFYTTLFAPLASGQPTKRGWAELFRGVAREGRGWHTLLLYPMARDSPLYDQTLSALRAAGWVAFSYYGFGNWFMRVAGRSFAEYYAGLSSRLRHTADRKEKKFLAGGRGQVTLVVGEKGLAETIAIWEKIYNASWKKPEPFPEFMPGLIRVCAAQGWLRMGLAHYDGEAVAAQVWIVCAGKACIYKLAYDENYASLSAGTILSKHLMRHVLDVDKVDEVDYLIGDDEYKKEWLDQRRERWGIVAYNPRTVTGLLGALKEAAGRAVKGIIGRPVTAASQAQGKRHDGSGT